jgi:hypothetical protein
MLKRIIASIKSAIKTARTNDRLLLAYSRRMRALQATEVARAVLDETIAELAVAQMLLDVAVNEWTSDPTSLTRLDNLINSRKDYLA